MFKVSVEGSVKRNSDTTKERDPPKMTGMEGADEMTEKNKVEFFLVLRSDERSSKLGET